MRCDHVSHFLVIEMYTQFLAENKSLHPAVSAIRVLTEVLRASQSILLLIFISN